MATVIPRSKFTPRPRYLPTAVEERLNRPVLPSDTISAWERQRLQHRGITADMIDTLQPDIVLARIDLPEEPIPETPMRVYKP